jgi:hypothetical protein
MASSFSPKLVLLVIYGIVDLSAVEIESGLQVLARRSYDELLKFSSILFHPIRVIRSSRNG